jgi:hypothetical protein
MGGKVIPFREPRPKQTLHQMVQTYKRAFWDHHGYWPEVTKICSDRVELAAGEYDAFIVVDANGIRIQDNQGVWWDAYCPSRGLLVEVVPDE